MAAINLGVLNITSRVDLTGMNKGLAQVRTAINTTVQKIPAIGRATQAATAVANSSLATMRGVMATTGGAVKGLVGAFTPLLAILAPAALIGGIISSVKAFTDQEEAVKNLDSALKLTIASNAEAGATSEELAQATAKASKEAQEFASALQAQTIFGDEVIIGVQAIISAMAKLSGDSLKKATQATLDLSAGMGLDLKSAGDLVAKTLGSTTNALARYGIEVEGAVGSTERLDSLVTSISQKFDGFARAQAQTFSGRMKQLKNVIGDVQEEIGKFVLMMLDLGGTSDQIIGKLVAFGDAIKKSTGTAEFEQLVTVVKEAFSAFGDLASQALDTLLAFFGMSKQTDNTSKVLTAFTKVGQVVIVALRGLNLGLSFVQVGLKTLVAAWKAGWTGILAVISGTAITIIRNAERIGNAMESVARLFGVELPGPINTYRQSLEKLRSEIASGMVPRMNEAEDAIFAIKPAVENADEKLVDLVTSIRQLSGAAETSRTKVTLFADEANGAGRSAEDLADGTKEASGAVKELSSSADEAKDRMKQLEGVMRSAERASDGLRSTLTQAGDRFSNMGISLSNEIELLRQRNATLNASGQIEKVQSQATEERIRIEQEKKQALKEVNDTITETARKEAELRTAIETSQKAIRDASLAGIQGATPEEAAKRVAEIQAQQDQLNILLEEQKKFTVEKQAIDQKAADERVQIEERANLQIKNINEESGQEIRDLLNKQAELNAQIREAEIDAQRRANDEQLSQRVKAIEQDEKDQLRRLEITKKTRILNGEEELRVEASIQEQRLRIIGASEEKILELKRITNERVSEINRLADEYELRNEEEKIAVREATNAVIEADAKKRAEIIQTVINAELFKFEEGELRISEILQNVAQRTLEAIIEFGKQRLSAWIATEQARVLATKQANAEISASTAATGGIVAPGGAGGGLGGILSGLVSGLPGILVSLGSSLALSFASKFFSKSKDKEQDQPTRIVSGIQSASKGVFVENQRRTTSVAQSVARDTGATNLIQQITFPVAITVQTQESDRIAEEIKRTVENDVVPTLKREIATKEREQMLKSIATPRRLAVT